MAPDSDPTTDSAALDALGLTDSRPSRRRRLLLTMVAMAIVGILAWLVWPRGAATPAFATVPVTRGELQVLVTATGSLEPVNQVDVGTEVSGTIRTVLVDYNDRVTRGQVLARIDTDELQAQVLQGRANRKAAEARVAQARATVEESRLKRDRCATLAERQMCSWEELDTDTATYLRAQAELASARAQVEVAQAALNAQETRLEKAEIRSPVDGLVLSRQIEPGQTVAASLQTPVLFVLAEDLTEMELHIDVDEADVGQVREGQSATFTVDAYPDRTFPARITQVRFAPEAQSGVVTYETVLEVDNRELLLRPGMTATADVLVARVPDALLVPNAALRFQPPELAAAADSGGSFFGRLMPRPPRASRRSAAPAQGSRGGDGQTLWRLANGSAESLTVRTGLSDGVRTEIVDGALAEGDAVIVGTGQGKP